MEANTNKLNLRAVTFALAALTVAVPTAAHAETGPRTERVSYGDLNLASEAGVKALDRRLDRAVRRVCGDDHRNLVMSSSVKNCIETARASIRPQREFAIARANGQDGKAWAENNRGQAVVALAE